MVVDVVRPPVIVITSVRRISAAAESARPFVAATPTHAAARRTLGAFVAAASSVRPSIAAPAPDSTWRRVFAAADSVRASVAAAPADSAGRCLTAAASSFRPAVTTAPTDPAPIAGIAVVVFVRRFGHRVVLVVVPRTLFVV